jgi:PAS domain S-box-containing protein
MIQNPDKRNKPTPDLPNLESELAQLRRRVAELEALEVKHKQAEEALANERNLLRTFIDNLPDFIYFKDTESRFLIANVAVARLVAGVTPDELIGKTDFDFFPRALAAKYYADEQAVMASGQPLVNLEEPVIDYVSDEPRWLLTTKVPLRDSQGKIIGVVGVGRDLTERKLAEEALQQSKQQIENILESITDAFFAVDNDWYFTYVNQRAEQLLHKTRAELLAKSLWTEFPEAVGSKFEVEYRRAMAEQITLEFEEYYEPFQTWFKVHAYPYSDGLSVYFRDITERKHAEAILAQRAAQLTLINDIASKIAAVLDLDSLLDRAARLVYETFNYHHVALFLLDEDQAKLKAIAGSYKTYFPPGHSQKMSQGIIGWVATHGEKVVANDVGREPRYISLIPDYTETRAELCIPLKIAGQTVGVLDVQSPHFDTFSENDIMAMEILTDQIAVAIENARLYQTVRQELSERKQAEGQLRQSKQQVLNILDHLEELVTERTAELTVSNKQLHQEIVERKRVEEALRQSEANFRALIENVKNLFIRYDLDLRYQYVSPAIRNFLDVKPEDFIGKRHREVGFPEKLADFFDNALKEAIISGETVDIEFSMQGRSGPVFLEARIYPEYDENGQVRSVVTVTHDITERKQAQESLQRYAERLKTLQELDRAILATRSPEAIAQVALHHLQQLVPFRQAAVVAFDFDRYDAVMLAAYAHGRATVMVGQHPPLDMFGIAEELRQSSVKAPENILTLAQPPLALQTLPPEGIRCYINVPLVARGQLIGGLNLGTDMADVFTSEHVDIARELADPLALAIQQARLHEQVQHHAAELEQRVAERTAKLEEINAELNSFSFSVSHDLRAPLRAVQGFAAALLEDYTHALDPLGQDYAQRIIDAAQRMDALIQDLLVYSRLSRTDLRLQPVDLSVVMTDVLTQLEMTIVEHQAEIRLAEPFPHVIGHHSTLVQIVTNLMTNAMKFVAPGVQPFVRVWAEITPASTVQEAEKGRWVRFWVEDNGIGIAPEQHERVFQIFERLHGIEAYPGTGVGLAIVRKGAIRMGGCAGIESSPGQGSKFWIELPQAAD